jgi:hypothetical protein
VTGTRNRKTWVSYFLSTIAQEYSLESIPCNWPQWSSEIHSLFLPLSHEYNEETAYCNTTVCYEFLPAHFSLGRSLAEGHDQLSNTHTHTHTHTHIFAVLRLELRAFSLSHSSSPLCNGYFWDRVLQTICLGWLLTVNLLISASWVARITGVNHWCLAKSHNILNREDKYKNYFHRELE